MLFQHTAARRRLVDPATGEVFGSPRFNTQPPEGGWGRPTDVPAWYLTVSTHSRPKAAGDWLHNQHEYHRCFNTQPPEGGWVWIFCLTEHCSSRFNTQPPEGGWRRRRTYSRLRTFGFNTQPPEGGWITSSPPIKCEVIVSTHSRPKAAG